MAIHSVFFFSILARSAVECWASCSSFRSFAHSFACSTLLALLALSCLFLCLSVCLTKKLSDFKEMSLIIREIAILVQYSAHPSLSHYGSEQKKTDKIAIKSFNFPQVREWMNERMSKHSGARKRSKQGKASEWVQTSKCANGQASSPALQSEFLVILDHNVSISVPASFYSRVCPSILEITNKHHLDQAHCGSDQPRIGM